MLGFAAAAGAELFSGEGVLQQLNEATVPILGAFAVITVASLFPILKGDFRLY
jgi:hypothetical protein